MSPQTQFWNWFLSHESQLFKAKDNQSAIFQDLGPMLRLIHPTLTYEMSIIKANGKKEFTVSADGNIEAFSAVIDTVDTAPHEQLPQWEIVAFRQQSPNVGVIRFKNGFKIDLQDLHFNYSIEEGGEQISLRIYGSSPKQYEDLYYMGIPILFDALLGEFDAVTRIRHLNLLAPDDPYDTEKFTMDVLPKVIESLKKK